MWAQYRDNCYFELVLEDIDNNVCDRIQNDNIQNNCVHASDSAENAIQEIAFFFSARDIIMNQ